MKLISRLFLNNIFPMILCKKIVPIYIIIQYYGDMFSKIHLFLECGHTPLIQHSVCLRFQKLL